MRRKINIFSGVKCISESKSAIVNETESAVCAGYARALRCADVMRRCLSDDEMRATKSRMRTLAVERLDSLGVECPNLSAGLHKRRRNNGTSTKSTSSIKTLIVLLIIKFAV